MASTVDLGEPVVKKVMHFFCAAPPRLEKLLTAKMRLRLPIQCNAMSLCVLEGSGRGGLIVAKQVVSGEETAMRRQWPHPFQPSVC
jgi:hypothetical protein